MPRRPIDIHPEARLEQDAVFDWYCEHSVAAAHEFLHQIENARDAIQQSPEAWADHLHGTRRYLLKGFPYIVVYRLGEARIESSRSLMAVASRDIGSTG